MKRGQRRLHSENYGNRTKEGQKLTESGIRRFRRTMSSDDIHKVVIYAEEYWNTTGYLT